MMRFHVEHSILKALLNRLIATGCSFVSHSIDEYFSLLVRPHTPSIRSHNDVEDIALIYILLAAGKYFQNPQKQQI